MKAQQTTAQIAEVSCASGSEKFRLKLGNDHTFLEEYLEINKLLLAKIKISKHKSVILMWMEGA